MDLPPLKDKVAIVTGAAGGIGDAAARLFAQNGATVCGLDLEPGENVYAQLDLTRHDEVRATLEAVEQEFGRVDILFNVAGGSGRKWGDGPVHECSEEAWDRVMDMNLKSIFLCCKYAISGMLGRRSGSIINLSSVLGLVGGDDDFATHAYAAAKGAIISLTRGIASYYAPMGIRANVICPGLIATGMSRRAQSDDRIRARLPELQPLTGDFGRPEDVAQAALYLASDQAAFVTGSVLTVDGGWTVR